MNGGQQAELSGTQPSREVEAAGGRGRGDGPGGGELWEIPPAGSELRSQRDGGTPACSGLVHVHVGVQECLSKSKGWYQEEGGK